MAEVSPSRAAEVRIHPVTPERWDDLAALFERPGPRGGRQPTANCWCVVWRDTFGDPGENRQRLRDRVAHRDEPGLLAYRDGEPVGWVSVAPREHFAVLLRSPTYRPREDEDGVFVITCFAVDRTARGVGIAGALVRAAAARAIERGATAIEAYPGDPPDYKGRLSWFLEEGFVPVREVGKRTVVRYDVT